MMLKVKLETWPRLDVKTLMVNYYQHGEAKMPAEWSIQQPQAIKVLYGAKPLGTKRQTKRWREYL